MQSIVNDINSKGFSPLEKAVAIYDIVQSIKPYKHGPTTGSSRYFYDYLNNNYMVCLGYADFMLNLGHMLGENYCIMHCPRTF